ncbi:hypothetical protein DY000_02040896 [Brassica cretica]|uniref:DUF295 domain-containing protein n=1 Tax=Brassica cretica TaxID=69181 RepID=A0ABQ7BKS0_BRACR|nr:hypothetical protein DY000_02040896 [Brassica cretica]
MLHREGQFHPIDDYLDCEVEALSRSFRPSHSVPLMIKWRCCQELVQFYEFRSVEVLLDTPPGSPKNCPEARGGSVRVQNRLIGEPLALDCLGWDSEGLYLLDGDSNSLSNIRSWSKFCDSDRIIPNPSRSASGPWCWVGRSVMFLFDCWLAGWPFISNPLDGSGVLQGPPLGSQNGDHCRRNKNGAFSGAPSEPLSYQPPERLPKWGRGMRNDRGCRPGAKSKYIAPYARGIKVIGKADRGARQHPGTSMFQKGLCWGQNRSRRN